MNRVSLMEQEPMEDFTQGRQKFEFLAKTPEKFDYRTQFNFWSNGFDEEEFKNEDTEASDMMLSHSQVQGFVDNRYDQDDCLERFFAEGLGADEPVQEAAEEEMMRGVVEENRMPREFAKEHHHPHRNMDIEDQTNIEVTCSGGSVPAEEVLPPVQKTPIRGVQVSPFLTTEKPSTSRRGGRPVEEDNEPTDEDVVGWCKNVLKNHFNNGNRFVRDHIGDREWRPLLKQLNVEPWEIVEYSEFLRKSVTSFSLDNVFGIWRGNLKEVKFNNPHMTYRDVLREKEGAILAIYRKAIQAYFKRVAVVYSHNRKARKSSAKMIALCQYYLRELTSSNRIITNEALLTHKLWQRKRPVE